MQVFPPFPQGMSNKCFYFVALNQYQVLLNTMKHENISLSSLGPENYEERTKLLLRENEN